MSAHFYRVGVEGVAWGPAERAAWLLEIEVKRSYQDEVLAKIELLKGDFDVENVSPAPPAPTHHGHTAHVP